MIGKKPSVGAITTIAGWIGGYVIAWLILADSPAVSAYRYLIGWWFAAYLVAKFQIPISAVVPLGILYFIVFVISALLGRNWFYHDIQGSGIGHILLMAITQSLFIVSPLLFDRFVTWLKRICMRK